MQRDLDLELASLQVTLCATCIKWDVGEVFALIRAVGGEKNTNIL